MILKRSVAYRGRVGFPAMVGAEPCTGSYNPTAPPILAEESIPNEPAITAATFYAVVYGRALTQTQLDAVLGGVRSIQP